MLMGVMVVLALALALDYFSLSFGYLDLVRPYIWLLLYGDVRCIEYVWE